MSAIEPYAGPRLRELEGVIERGKQTFIDVGAALMEIRDRRLYKERAYKSFNDYTTEHLGFQRAHAHRLIEAAVAVKELSPVGDTFAPVNERQARELAQATEGTRAEVMQQAHAVAEERDQPVTAAIIREVVREEEPLHYVPCSHCGGTGRVVA